MTEIIPLSQDALDGIPERVKPTHKSIPLGLDENGDIVWLPFHSNNALLAGLPGTGKSATETNLVAQMAQLPNVAIIFIDALVVEAKQFEKRASFTSRGRCCGDIVTRLVWEEGNRRLALMEREDLRKITPEMAERFPMICVIVDEAAAQFQDPDDKRNSGLDNESFKYVRKIVAEQRKCSHNVIVATQRPDATTVPTQLRNIISQIICHAVNRATDVDMIMGKGMSEKAPAHEITTSELGVGYVMSSESRGDPKRFRSSLIFNEAERAAVLEDPDASEALKDIALNSPSIDEVMSATEHLRVPLHFLDESYELQEHLAWHDAETERILAEEDERQRRKAS